MVRGGIADSSATGVGTAARTCFGLTFLPRYPPPFSPLLLLLPPPLLAPGRFDSRACSWADCAFASSLKFFADVLGVTLLLGALLPQGVVFADLGCLVMVRPCDSACGSCMVMLSTLPLREPPEGGERVLPAPPAAPGPVVGRRGVPDPDWNPLPSEPA